MSAYTWNGSANDGNYNNPANWTPNGVPGAGDTATINTSTASVITELQDDSVQALTLGKLDTLAISTGETYTVGNAAASSTLAVAGTLSLNSTGYDTALVVDATTLTLNGGGEVLLGNANGSNSNLILAGAAGDVLANVSDKIVGAGEIGDGTALGFTNAAAGIVDANVSNQLVINTGSVTASNAGLFEATAGGGGLVLQTAVNNATSGRIAASGAEVYLNGATILGGTLSSTAGYSVQVVSTSALDGTANEVTNAGSLVVDTGQTLSVLGTLNNTGVLSLQSTGYNSDVIFGVGGTLTSTVTLTGSGHVVLGDGDSSNRLYGGNAGDTLVNLNNTISGSGTIGAGQLKLVNDGTISATGTANALFIQTNSFTNNGLLEATGSQGLILQSVVTDSSTGKLASAGGTIQLYGATIIGGTLTSSAGGSFAVTSQGTLQNLTNAGIVEVNTGTTLSLLGTITNAATIGLNSTGYNSDLIIGSPTTTLIGGGTIALGGNNTSDRIYGAVTADTLDNVNNTIEGFGELGADQLTLINGTAGVIDATGANGLTLQTATTVINDGLIEATGAGVLSVESTVNDSGGGTILAASTVIYLNGGDIQGGLLLSTGTGQFSANGQTTLDGSAQAVTVQGALEVATGDTMTVLGTITNDGTIGLNSSGYDSDLIIGGTLVTLSGGGTLVLTDNNGSNRIYGSALGNELDNVNNLIEGSGQLGAGQLTLVNGAAGVIDATGTSNQLVISTGTTLVNDGLIEATGAAGMALSSTVNDSGGGTILANGGTVYLNGADIQGGLLATSGKGQLSANGQTTLDGTAQQISLTGTLEVATGDTMTLLGTIDNTGVIGLNSSGYDCDLVVGSPTVTLTGGGTLVLTDNNGSNRIYGASAAYVLDNVNNKIEGSGQLGAGQLTLLNGAAGVIDATGASNQLVISTGEVLTNDGLIESTGAAGLALESTVSNTTGTILAAGSTIYLNGADVQGGRLASNATGQLSANGQTTLDGSAHAVTVAGALEVATGSTMTVLGTITNTGTIGLNSTGYNSDLILGTPTVTLNGSGTIALGGNNTSDRIYGAATTDVLYNVNDTIEGFGQLGAGQLKLVNSGTISSTGTGGLTINLGSTGLNKATGELLGVGTGGLAIQNGTYTNAGLIQADDGSSVTFSNGATLTNESTAGGLVGGTYAAMSSGDGATLTLAGAALKTDGADLVLSGAGSSIQFGTTTVESSLNAIAAHGELQILDGRSYTSTLGLANSGTVVLGGGTLTDKGLNGKAGSVLSGFGTVTGHVISAGALDAVGGTLELTGSDTITGLVSGTGTLALSAGHSTLDDTNPVTVSTIALINKATLAITNPLSFGGTFDIVGASALTGSATISSSGLFEQTGHGVATIANALTNTGTISTGIGGTLAFQGGLSNSGLILDKGGFTDTAALTGGSLSVGGKGTSAVLASASGAGSTLSTLSIAGGTLDTSGTTLSVTGDYVNTAAGTGNAYNPDAGVSGTIDGQSTQLSVVGVDGTTVQDVNGTLTIMVTAGQTAHFVIENTGASGSANLRGALQTTVNGGSITGTALSGAGVTAGNFGPIAAGSSSGTYGIAYKGGTLSGEAIHLATDFANVAGVTIDIVAKPAGSATPAYAAGTVPDVSVPWTLPWLHHGAS